MAWQTPKTNWQAADAPLPDDFNRIEGNVQDLQNTKETPPAPRLRQMQQKRRQKATPIILGRL